MAQPDLRTTSISASGPPRLVAVIDIGATSIRMEVAEIRIGGSVRKLDALVQAIELGREVFATRRISRDIIEKAANILTKYQRLLREYGIADSDVRVVATSAVREATNRVAFTDRIYVATGLHVDTIDDAEVNRITYMGIIPHLTAHDEISGGKAVVVEVGGGSTELLIVRDGNVIYSGSFRLGSLRLLRMLDASRAGASRHRALLEGHIRRAVVQIADNVRTDESTHLIALGGDMRFVAKHLQEGWDGRSLTRLATGDVEAFTDELLALDEDQIVKRYGASFIEAETVATAMLANVMLAKHFDLSHMYVCETNLRDGLLNDIAVGGNWTAEFRNQIVRSAQSLGRKFGVDEAHGRQVAELAGKLFHQLLELHGLENRHEVLLYVAAMLHELGIIVNVRSNHKHALYLIRHSELFGLSKSELLQVGLIVRYYRRANPQATHDAYGTLDREQRVVVAKLASLLRLALALDDTRSGRIREIECTLAGKRLVITVPGVDDVSLEQVAMRQNSGLFEEVFGMSVLLRSGN